MSYFILKDKVQNKIERKVNSTKKELITDADEIISTTDEVIDTIDNENEKSGNNQLVDKAIDIEAVGTTFHTATFASWRPDSAFLSITIPNHGFKNGDRVRISNHSMTFTCSMDQHYSKKTYPRLSDAASGLFLPISNVTRNNFDVNIGNTKS